MLIVPTLSLHGTSKDALVQQRIDCIEALRCADTVLRAHGPHMRDFNDDAAFKAAREAWVERLRMVQNIITDLEVEAALISEKGN
jgi:hypothetical protein